MSAPRSTRQDVDGWVVLDKPVGMTSTHAVSRLKRIFNAKKAGHAGTLDPLASGILPVAFGEATKTVPFVQDGEKAYRFTVRFGAETDTDDADGRVTAQSEHAAERAAEILALLPQFIGTIQQTPPAFSAIKIGGERAYDIARDGETPAAVRAAGDHPRPRSPERGSGRGGVRGALRQRHLRARHRPRSRPPAWLFRPCHRVAPDARRPLFRGGRHSP